MRLFRQPLSVILSLAFYSFRLLLIFDHIEIYFNKMQANLIAKIIFVSGLFMDEH